ncbi:hypothetical protein D3C85_999930 [compost metagenome]
MGGDAVLGAGVEREGEGSRCPCAGGVFALGLADDVVVLAGLHRQPGDVGTDLGEVHAHRRLARALWITRLAVDALAAGAGVAIGQGDSGFLEVLVPFASGDLVAAHGERLVERHLMHRAFIRLTADFVFRGAHGECAGGQHDHFRAVTAILEDLARQRRRIRLGEAGHGTAEQCQQHQGAQAFGTPPVQDVFHKGSR